MENSRCSVWLGSGGIRTLDHCLPCFEMEGSGLWYGFGERPSSLVNLRPHLHLQRCITDLHNNSCEPDSVVWDLNPQIAGNELQAVEGALPCQCANYWCRPQKMFISGISQCDASTGVSANVYMRWYLFQSLFCCRSLLLIGTHACFQNAAKLCYLHDAPARYLLCHSRVHALIALECKNSSANHRRLPSQALRLFSSERFYPTTYICFGPFIT